MKLIVDIHGEHYALINAPIPISIPLNFDRAQPQFFGVEKARAKPLEMPGFCGSTSQGAGCNVSEVNIVPHCCGTHTESARHIFSNAPTINEIKIPLLLACLVSVETAQNGKTSDAYGVEIQAQDQYIDRKTLERAVGVDLIKEGVQAMIIRTKPNPQRKQYLKYGQENPSTFLTNDAMAFINELSIKHLLVDFPSVDRADDGGHLSSHRVFWGGEKEGFCLGSEKSFDKTITEFVYVDDNVLDGLYVLSLNPAPFALDAAPSGPVIYALERR